MVKRSILRRLLASIFDCFFGSTGLFYPLSEDTVAQPRSAIVLSPGVIPTTEIYLKGRLEKRFNGAVEYVNTLEISPRKIEMKSASLVVVVRYAPLRWLVWLKNKRSQLDRLTFLMDDDMPAALLAAELPLGYAMKTACRYALNRRFLKRCCSEIWVSTPELARRYPSAATRVVEPGYVFPTTGCGDRKVYFYHGTWSHRREIQWMVTVIRQIQQVLPNVWFEVMGTDRVRRMFRSIPRVRVVHPMTWEDYRNYAANCSYRVGLAPCLDSIFNKGRSYSKIFDITATGAVGVYSDGLPYAGKVVHGHTGLLCKNDPDAWTVAILLLLNDRCLRASMFEKAQEWCLKHAFISNPERTFSPYHTAGPGESTPKVDQPGKRNREGTKDESWPSN